MKVRQLLVLWLSLFLVATACDGGDEAVTPSPGGEGTAGPTGSFSLAEASEPYRGTEIRVLDEITDLQPGFYENVVPLFEEETGIDVNHDLQSHFDVSTNGLADLLSGAGRYDAVMLHRQEFPNALQGSGIEFLDPYLDNASLSDPSIDFTNFIGPLDAGTQFGDQRICFPNWSYNFVWIGRRDLFEHSDEQAAFEEEYGYDLAPPETLQQMRDIGEFFTRQEGESLAGETLTEPFYGYVQDGHRLSTIWQDVWANSIQQFGGDLFDEAGNPTANRPENVAGLEFWASMFEFAPPGASEVSLVDLPVILGQERVASMVGFSDFFFTVDSPGGSPVAGNLIYAALPFDENNPDSRSMGFPFSCLVISPASQNKEATFLFLQWLVSQEAQDAYLESSVEIGGGFDPVLTASLENPAFTSGPRANLNEAIAGSLAVGTIFPLHQNMIEVTDAINQRAQEVLLGQMSAEAALDALQQDLESICPSDCFVEP